MGSQYSIKDLESMTDIKPRTIHYYIKERLIKPAIGEGGGASYNDEHLIRLKLIKEMKKSHLKLSGIKQALDAMSIEGMSKLYEKAKKGSFNWDRNSLGNWMEDSMDGKPSDIETSTIGGQANDSMSMVDYNYLQHLKRAALPDSSWKRFYVIDGIEINIRSDLMENYKTKILYYIDELRRIV